jgi:hypothetical protein
MARAPPGGEGVPSQAPSSPPAGRVRTTGPSILRLRTRPFPPRAALLQLGCDSAPRPPVRDRHEAFPGVRAGGTISLSFGTPDRRMQVKARNLAVLALGVLLVASLWSCASAAVPRLAGVWDLDPGQRAWLTMSVQIGVVAGFPFDHPLPLALLCLAWGFAVVADSAPFSAAVSEIAHPLCRHRAHRPDQPGLPAHRRDHAADPPADRCPGLAPPVSGAGPGTRHAGSGSANASEGIRGSSKGFPSSFAEAASRSPSGASRASPSRPWNRCVPVRPCPGPGNRPARRAGEVRVPGQLVPRLGLGPEARAREGGAWSG